MAHSNWVIWGDINKGTIYKGVSRVQKNRRVDAVPGANYSKAVFPSLGLKGRQKDGGGWEGGRRGRTGGEKEEIERQWKCCV